MKPSIRVQIASIPDRVDSLMQTVKSLLLQVDEMFIGLNNYYEEPSFCKDSKITTMLFDNSMGDAVKFYNVERFDGYFFTCDDDLVYPKNYVHYIVNRINMYNQEAIITLHGRNYYNIPVKSFHRDPFENHRCLMDVRGDHPVMIGGTGVMAFHTSTLNVSYSDFKAPNMADVWMAKLAHEQGVPIMVVDHRAGYLRYIPPETTIWRESLKNDKLQTEILNSFL